MKKIIGICILLLLLLTFTSCQDKVSPPDSSAAGKTEPVSSAVPSSSETENPAESSQAESSQESSAEDPAGEISFEALDLSCGEHAVSDGEYIFFTVHSDDDPASMKRDTDGLYRADRSMKNPVRLARGDCHSLVLENETVYFIMEDFAGVCAVCSVDRQGTEIRRIVTDVEGAKDLCMSGGKLYYVYMGSLYVIEDAEQGTVKELREDRDYDQVLQAAPGDGDTVWFTSQNTNTLQIMLRLYDPAEGTMWGVVPVGHRFARNEEGTVFYTYSLENQPDYEDYRQYEYIMMRMDDLADPHPTELTGRFYGDFYAYGPYLFYSEFQEIVRDSDPQAPTVRRLMCCDTRTYSVTAFPWDGFADIDMTIRSVTAGRLFYNAYDYSVGAPDESEFIDCRCTDLTGTGETVSLNSLIASCTDSEAVQADDAAIEEYIAQREREKEEELRNEPYGPGTSYLYLKASDTKSAAYRLVRMDGTTQFMVLLAPGEETTQSFPCGRYKLKVAKGETWISDEEAFGSSGNYSTTDVFKFESGATYQISTGTTGDFRGDSQHGFTD